jgi:hypothetical protein
MPLLLCCSAVLHGIVWHPQCAYANLRETSKLDSVHNTQNDTASIPVHRLEIDNVAGSVAMTLPVPCSNKTFIQHFQTHTIANISGWQYTILFRYVNFLIYHNWHILFTKNIFFRGENLSSLPNFRWLLFIVVNGSKTPHPVHRQIQCIRGGTQK